MGQGASKENHFKELLKTLKGPKIPATKTEWWGALWDISVEFNELFQYIRFSDIVELRKQSPYNLAVLVYYAVNELLRVLENQPIHPNKDRENSRALAAVRLLARIIPPLLADNSDNFTEMVFWTYGPLDTGRFKELYKQNTGAEEIIAMITPKPENEKTEQAPETTPQNEGVKPEEPQPEDRLIVTGQGNQPLARVIVQTLVKLLFLEDFTIASTGKKPGEERSMSELVWAPGLGIQTHAVSPTTAAANRRDILKALLACFCQSLYRKIDEWSAQNPWLDVMTTTDIEFSRPLLYSLINIACTYDPIGWGLPYNYLLFSDLQEAIADVALQVICVIILHIPSHGAGNNKFVEYIREIDTPEEFKVVYKAVVRLISNPIVANNTYLPASTKMVDCHREVLMLFWKFLLENKSFVEYIIRSEDITEVVIPILFFILDGRKDEAALGLIHLCVFVLLILSGERMFAIQLNRPFVPNRRMDLPVFKGNVADFLILVGLKLLSGDANKKLVSLHECMLTIIANLSPYIKQLCMLSSMKLIDTFVRYSNPAVILKKERAHRYVAFLLETFNNLIQYQYEGNYSLVYAILRNRDSFTTLPELEIVEPLAAEVIESTPGEERAEDSIVSDKSAPSANHSAPKDSSFVPTQEWLNSWKSEMPFSTTLRLISALLPEIPSLITGSGEDEQHIIQYLEKTTLVGLLPPPHPILIRRFQPNNATALWLHRFLWGVTYLRSKDPPLFGSAWIKLFTVIQ